MRSTATAANGDRCDSIFFSISTSSFSHANTRGSSVAETRAESSSSSWVRRVKGFEEEVLLDLDFLEREPKSLSSFASNSFFLAAMSPALTPLYFSDHLVPASPNTDPFCSLMAPRKGSTRASIFDCSTCRCWRATRSLWARRVMSPRSRGTVSKRRRSATPKIGLGRELYPVPFRAPKRPPRGFLAHVSGEKKLCKYLSFKTKSGSTTWLKGSLTSGPTTSAPPRSLDSQKGGLSDTTSKTGRMTLLRTLIAADCIGPGV
mmetsp:Transcript_19898/g.41361  ORF Transcript_19898/g.41361 Transcript_19898/m.41361 type:complete len:261 (+) Transcript_19898:913-1695(+)